VLTVPKKCKGLEQRIAKKEKDRVANLIAETSGENWAPGPSGTMEPLKVPHPLPHRKRKLPHGFDICIEPAGSCRVATNVAEVAFRKP